MIDTVTKRKMTRAPVDQNDWFTGYDITSITYRRRKHYWSNGIRALVTETSEQKFMECSISLSSLYDWLAVFRYADQLTLETAIFIFEGMISGSKESSITLTGAVPLEDVRSRACCRSAGGITKSIDWMGQSSKQYHSNVRSSRSQTQNTANQ